MVLTEIVTLGSRYRDGSLMYPGRYLLTWVRVGKCHILVNQHRLPD